MTKIKRLLNLMADDKFYREKDLLDMIDTATHSSISMTIYYGVKQGYIERRKRTIRNWEYRRKISLKDKNTRRIR